MSARLGGGGWGILLLCAFTARRAWALLPLPEAVKLLRLQPYQQRGIQWSWFLPFILALSGAFVLAFAWQLYKERRMARHLVQLQALLMGHSVPPERVLQPGARLEICRFTKDESNLVVLGRSLLDQVENRWIAILSPMREGLVLPLHQGDEVLVRVLSSSGLYEFWTRVQAVRQEPSGRLYWLVKPERVFRNQRRQYFRAQVELPVLISPVPPPRRVLDEEEGEEQAAETWDPPVFPGRTLDLSGGGAKVRCDAPLLAGERVQVKMDLGPDAGWVEVPGTITKVLEDLEGTRFCIKFGQLAESLRQKIIARVLEAEREKRRKAKAQPL